MQKTFLHLIFTSWMLLTGIAQAHPPKEFDKNMIFVFPEAGRTPLITAINSAKKTIDMAAYRLSDPQIIETLEKAKKRGVTIHLLIEPNIFVHEKGYGTNPIDHLKSIGIHIYTLSKRFNQAHYKMIVIDKSWGLLGTGNAAQDAFEGTEDVPACRDFSVPILKSSLVHELLRIFNADIHDERVVPRTTKLVWGPDQQRSTFLRMINSAKKSIRIYQQSFEDVGMAQALAGAARAGVDVQLIMPPFPFSRTVDGNIPNQTLITQAGAKVVLNTKIYIHAKVMIVDDKEMYVGSCNMYSPSIDQTRELGIIIDTPKPIKTVLETFQKDWEESEAFRTS